jgi:hypothetical protein
MLLVITSALSGCSRCPPVALLFALLGGFTVAYEAASTLRVCLIFLVFCICFICLVV